MQEVVPFDFQGKSVAPITMLRWREQATMEVLKAASKENLS